MTTLAGERFSFPPLPAPFFGVRLPVELDGCYLTRHDDAMRWHYTTLDRVRQILVDGQIKPATAYIAPGEKPAVWFSSNPIWEQTANKGLMTPNGRVSLNKEQMIELGEVLARIAVAVETAPHDWKAYCRLSGVPTKVAHSMRAAGFQVGSRIAEWFVCFEPVPRGKWLAIEVWDREKWVPHAPDATGTR